MGRGGPSKIEEVATPSALRESSSFGDSINYDVHNCRRSPPNPAHHAPDPLRMRLPTD